MGTDRRPYRHAWPADRPPEHGRGRCRSGSISSRLAPASLPSAHQRSPQHQLTLLQGRRIPDGHAGASAGTSVSAVPGSGLPHRSRTAVVRHRSARRYPSPSAAWAQRAANRIAAQGVRDRQPRAQVAVVARPYRVEQLRNIGEIAVAAGHGISVQQCRAKTAHVGREPVR